MSAEDATRKSREAQVGTRLAVVVLRLPIRLHSKGTLPSIHYHAGPCIGVPSIIRVAMYVFSPFFAMPHFPR